MWHGACLMPLYGRCMYPHGVPTSSSIRLVLDTATLSVACAADAENEVSSSGTSSSSSDSASIYNVVGMSFMYICIAVIF